MTNIKGIEVDEISLLKKEFIKNIVHKKDIKI
jgi:hypothetical protein